MDQSENISTLKKLLACDNLPKDTSAYYKHFGEIADLLMNKCVISKGEVNYEIVEIEFYLFTPDHQDVITYPRKTEAGQWYFHQSGVDLAFKSNEHQFGGILIRGLRKISDKRQILGPLKCVDELWDKSDAFEVNSDEYPIIKDSRGIIEEKKLSKCPRHIPLNGKAQDVKIKEWENRINKKIQFIFTTDAQSAADRAKLVFDSNYRFIRGSIDT